MGDSNTSTLPGARLALAMLLLAYILSFIDRQILSLMVGPIRTELGIGDFQFSLLSGAAFALFYTLMGLPIGRWADSGNRSRIIVIGIALWSMMTALGGLARSFGTLFATRVGVAVGEAALSPPSYSLLSDYFSPERLPRALAIYTLGITLGGGMAYLIGGAVIGLVDKMDPISWPLVGELAPWRLSLIAVGLPGLLVALAVYATVREPPRRLQSGEESSLLPVTQAISHLWRCRSDYAVVLYTVPLLSIAGYGFLGWYPEYLIRTFGAERSQAGYLTGWLYLLCGTAGTLCGARVAEALARRGYRDANGRLVALVASALPIPALLSTQAGSLTLAVALAAPVIFLLNAYFGVSLAALQLVAPNRMRAQLSAGLLFATNLLGLGLGTSAVAALSEFGFGDDAALGRSLALVSSAVTLLAALVAWHQLGGYRAAVERLYRDSL